MRRPRAAGPCILAAAVCLLLADCGPLPKASSSADLAAKTFEAPPGKGRVYFYRSPEFVGIGPFPENTVALDGTVIGVIAPGRYVVSDVEPGRHIVFAEWYIAANTEEGVLFNGDVTLGVDTEPGSVLFVRVHGDNELSLSGDVKGREAVARCRLAAPRVPRSGPRRMGAPSFPLDFIAVSGHVTDKADRPLQGVHVSLEVEPQPYLYGTSSITLEGTTDGEGYYFLIYKAKVHNYRIRYRQSGFRERCVSAGFEGRTVRLEPEHQP